MPTTASTDCTMGGYQRPMNSANSYLEQGNLLLWKCL